MECAVCSNSAALEIDGNTAGGKGFRCPHCGEYQISGSVYQPGLLKALKLPKREDALARAKLHAHLGKPPLITTYDL
jgi:hypothetical protein